MRPDPRCRSPRSASCAVLFLRCFPRRLGCEGAHVQVLPVPALPLPSLPLAKAQGRAIRSARRGLSAEEGPLPSPPRRWPPGPPVPKLAARRGVPMSERDGRIPGHWGVTMGTSQTWVKYGHHPLVAARARQLRRTKTRAERVLWERLRNAQICGQRFRRQQSLDGYVADFFCFRARLIVEVDGKGHAEQLEYDAARDARLEFGGFRVIRFTNSQVIQRTDWVLDQIDRVVAERIFQGRDKHGR
jgi:very-short-patch-repair endonuclease